MAWPHYIKVFNLEKLFLIPPKDSSIPLRSGLV
jgi:hypothetical protein